MKYIYRIFLIVLATTLFGCHGKSEATFFSPPTTPHEELKVISISPLNGASNTARDGSITVTFSHNLKATTVNAVTFTVVDEQHNPVDAGSIAVDADKATFQSKYKLVSDRKYIVTLASTIKGANDEAMAGDYISDFITTSSQWSSPELVNNLATDDATNAKIVMDNHGNAVTAWWRHNDITGCYEIVMSQLNNGSWTNPEVISGNTCNVYNPTVAMDNNGNAIIAWQDWGNLVSNCGIAMIEYRNGVWSSRRFLNTQAFIPTDPPSVAMNNNGKALIVWSQENIIYRLEYKNGNWGAPAVVSTDGYAEDPLVVINDEGNSIIIWLHDDGYATHHKLFSSEFQSGIWSDPKIISIEGYDPVNSQYKIVYDNKDNAIVVWVQENDQVFRNEYRNGNWTGPAAVNSSGEDVLYATVAMDGLGNAIIGWQQTVNLIYQAFTSELRDGVWSAPTQISTPGTAAGGPLIKMDKSGNAILMWNEANQIFRMQYLNGSWSGKCLMTFSYNSVDVAMDGSGDAIMAWSQSDGSTSNIYRIFYQ